MILRPIWTWMPTPAPEAVVENEVEKVYQINELSATCHVAWFAK